MKIAVVNRVVLVFIGKKNIQLVYFKKRDQRGKILLSSIINDNFNIKKTSYCNLLNNSKKVNKMNFKGVDLDALDKFEVKEINYTRLGTLISQKVDDKKINKIYDDFMSYHDETLGSKLQAVGLNFTNKLRRVVNGNSVTEKNAQVIAKIIGKMVPDSMKVERCDSDSYDLPIGVVDSVVTILDCVDNYSDCFDALAKYFDQMKRFGYTKDSYLPVVLYANRGRSQMNILYDCILEKQNR